MKLTVEAPSGFTSTVIAEAIRHHLRAYTLPVNFRGAVINNGAGAVVVDSAYLDSVAERCAPLIATEVLRALSKAQDQ